MTRSRRLNSQPESSPVLVEALDLDAQGITRLLDENGQPGKVVFIRGALPTEEVTYTLTRDKARFAKAKLHRLIKPAVYRTSPKCKVFGICGGCSMQHLDFIAQIAIKQMFPVETKANAQLDAISRTYTYYVHLEKDPYLNNFSTYYFIENLDFELIKKACDLIPTVRDFRNFCIEPDKHKSTHCTLRNVKMHLHSDKKRIAFRFEGDHYLRSMIRLLVGELLEVGKGRTSLEDFEGYLNLRIKKPKHHKAFAQGLHLSAISYPFFKTDLPELF